MLPLTLRVLSLGAVCVLLPTTSAFLMLPSLQQLGSTRPRSPRTTARSILQRAQMSKLVTGEYRGDENRCRKACRDAAGVLHE